MSKADKQHWTVGKALATHVGIPRTTLQSAVTQGRIPSYELGCGTIVVDVDDAMAFAGYLHEPRKHDSPAEAMYETLTRRGKVTQRQSKLSDEGWQYWRHVLLNAGLVTSASPQQLDLIGAKVWSWSEVLQFKRNQLLRASK